MFNISWSWHLGWSFEILIILPEVFESTEYISFAYRDSYVMPYSSVAFISGQDCGEQNSVIDP